jgi:EpsI family protein
MTTDPSANRLWLRRKLATTCGLLFVVAALSLTAALTAGSATYRGDHARSAIPAALPEAKPVWVGIDDPIEPRVLEILKTRDYLNREYKRADFSFPVYLTIIYSERNRKGVHPPKVCLQGAGYLALKETPVTFPGLGTDGGDLQALEMITERGSTRTYHLYFYKCGRLCTTSFVEQQLWIWLNGLRRRDASGALIRLSAPILGDDEAATRNAVRDLLTLVMPYIHKRL